MVGGILFIIAGIAVLIYGLAPFFGAFGNPWFSDFGSVAVGMFVAFGGGVLAMVGLIMVRMGALRAVTRYVAHEVSPAVETVTGAATTGVRRAGGLPLTVGSTEEVVKVRCQSCGALNDEADDYCGQCGKKL
jgi:vacuolar-type H+-ATPase subunit I/STV1